MPWVCSAPILSLSQGEGTNHLSCAGNKIEGGKRQKKLTSSELRKKKKERMARYGIPSHLSLLTVH
jgi:hypothetical protein